MGDRASLAILLPQPQNTPIQPLYVYTHWTGANLPQTVAQALWDGRPRWGEPSYLCRILIGTIIDLDTIDGYGVGMIPYGTPADAGRPALVVDTRTRTVGYVPWDDVYAGKFARLEHDYDSFIGNAQWPDTKNPPPKGRVIANHSRA